MTNREFDLVLFGATGFTGRLVAEVLAQHGGGETKGCTVIALGPIQDDAGDALAESGRPVDVQGQIPSFFSKVPALAPPG